MVTKEVTQPSQEPHKTSSYACCMCGFGHIMTNCLKLIEMQKMFHGIYVTIIEVQPIVEAQIDTTNVMWWMLMLQQKVKQLKNKCSRIENKGKQRVLLIGRKKNG